MQTYTYCLEYWRRRIRQQKLCVLMSRNIIKKNKKKLATKIGDYLGHFSTHDKAVEKSKIGLKEFKKAKSIAFERWKEFINKYIARWAKDCKVSPEIIKKLLQIEGKQEELGRISEDIRKQNTRVPVLKATVMFINTGVTTIIDTQNNIVEAAV